jgi:hypothetical protein
LSRTTLIHTIAFQIAESGHTTLKIYDLLGSEVATLVDQKMNPGTYRVTWDAGGRASGVYFYRLQVGRFADMRKLVLL